MKKWFIPGPFLGGLSVQEVGAKGTDGELEKRDLLELKRSRVKEARERVKGRG